ncbi:MAG: hypothetical protein Q8P41_23270 [Pseudomonadota bacterium]|nr:hypothetical protein [Pseudomonadota bacterium]
MLLAFLFACSAPPEETPPEMEELTWMMLRDFGTDELAGEAEYLAAWIDEEIEAAEVGYEVETPAMAYVEDLTFSENLELGNMSGGLVIKRVRGTLDAYAAVMTEVDQTFADDSYDKWERTLTNGSEAAWADHEDLVADDDIEKNGGFGIVLPYPSLRQYKWVTLERGEVIVSHAVIYEEGWADDSNGIVGGFTIEVLLPDGEDTIWLNCTWTQVISIVGDNPDFYTDQIIQGSTAVMAGTELYVSGPGE